MFCGAFHFLLLHVKAPTMNVSQKGRLYHKGKSLRNDLRSLIIDTIVEAGGDIVSRLFPGNFAVIAKTFKLKTYNVVKLWRQFVAKWIPQAPKVSSSWLRRLQPHDLDFIKFLKTDRPSLTSGELLRELNEYSQIPGGVSHVTINRTVRNCMRRGKW